MPKNEKSLDVNAKTIEEAVEQGLEQLGLARNQVNIDVLSEGKRGLFGLGSEEAVVRLTPKTQAEQAQPEPAASAQAPPAGEEPASAEPEPEPEPEEAADQPAETPIDTPEPEQPAPDDPRQKAAEIGVEYLSQLLELMGVKAEVTTRIAPDLVEPDETPPMVLDVTGNDLGILIGRRNETLQTLQYMVRLAVSKQMSSWQPLIVDVESYRARRRQSLHQMANRMAERAVANGERVVLEAMPAYERRIVHIALRDHPDVFTKSIGRDTNRKVTIIPK